MPRKSLHIKAIYYDRGIIATKEGKLLEWASLTTHTDPKLPFGALIELQLDYEELSLYQGEQGIVWATYDREQAETIQSALLVQKIFSELRPMSLEHRQLLLVFVPNEEDHNTAIDFIWRDKAGMRMKPDWHYPLGSRNRSYQKWLDAQ